MQRYLYLAILIWVPLGAFGRFWETSSTDSLENEEKSTASTSTIWRGELPDHHNIAGQQYLDEIKADTDKQVDPLENAEASTNEQGRWTLTDDNVPVTKSTFVSPKPGSWTRTAVRRFENLFSKTGGKTTATRKLGETTPTNSTPKPLQLFKIPPTPGQPVILSVIGLNPEPQYAELFDNGKIELVGADRADNAATIYADFDGYLRVLADPSLVFYLVDVDREGKLKEGSGMLEMRWGEEREVKASPNARPTSFEFKEAGLSFVDGNTNEEIIFHTPTTTDSGDRGLYAALAPDAPGFATALVIPVGAGDNSRLLVGSSRTTAAPTTPTKSTPLRTSSIITASVISTTAEPGPEESLLPVPWRWRDVMTMTDIQEIISVGGPAYSSFCYTWLGHDLRIPTKVFSTTFTEYVESTNRVSETYSETITQTSWSYTSTLTSSSWVTNSYPTTTPLWPRWEHEFNPYPTDVHYFPMTPPGLQKFKVEDLREGCRAVIPLLTQPQVTSSLTKHIPTATVEATTHIYIDVTETVTSTGYATSITTKTMTPVSGSGSVAFAQSTWLAVANERQPFDGSGSWLNSGVVANYDDTFSASEALRPAKIHLDEYGWLYTDLGGERYYMAVEPSSDDRKGSLIIWATKSWISRGGMEMIGGYLPEYDSGVDYPGRDKLVINPPSNAGGYNMWLVCSYPGDPGYIRFGVAIASSGQSLKLGGAKDCRMSRTLSFEGLL